MEKDSRTPEDDSVSAKQRFWNWLEKQREPTVIEIGTKAWDGKPPIHHKNQVLETCQTATWHGVDCEAGDGVDIVADAHRLSDVIQMGLADAIYCEATLEHLARPWIAAAEMAKITRIGGCAWIETHQSFPIHGYPNDYFRFTAEGLGELFSKDVGWEVVASEYFSPCQVVPKVNLPGMWNFEAPAYLNVGVFVRRIAA